MELMDLSPLLRYLNLSIPPLTHAMNVSSCVAQEMRSSRPLYMELMECLRLMRTGTMEKLGVWMFMNLHSRFLKSSGLNINM